MNLNILKPRQAVASAFEKPNMAIALALVFAASIFALAHSIVLGLKIDLLAFAVNVLVSGYIYFFITVILIYIAAFILKGKAAVAGKIPGIVSSLGLLQIPAIVADLVAVVAIPIIFSPLALALVGDVISGKTTVEVLAIQLNWFFANNATDLLINFTAAYAFIVVFAIIGLFNLYLLYRIVSKIFQYRILPNILIMLIILAILGLLPI